MFDAANGPTIPERTSVRTSLGSLRQDRRRRSLPAPSHHERRRDSNRVTVKPASTEVISSLIETLSTISTPAEIHFDSLPNIAGSQSTPVSPRPWRYERPAIGEPIHDMHGSVPSRSNRRPHGVDATYLLHPDRASRKGPASQSSPSRTATSLQTGAREPEDPYVLGGIYSIGNVSIETKPRQSSASINSAGSGTRKSVQSLRSMRSLRTLGFKSSRDSLRSGDERVVRKAKRGGERKPERLIIADKTPPQSPSPDQFLVAKRGARQSIITEAPNVPERASSAQSRNSPGRLYWNANDIASGPLETKSPRSIFEQDRVPTRESSRSRSVGLSSTHQLLGSHQSQQMTDHVAAGSSSEKHGHDLQVALQDVTDEIEPRNGARREVAEDFVNRRIKELKEQKMQRERSWIETTADLVPASEPESSSLTPSHLAGTAQAATSRLSESDEFSDTADYGKDRVMADTENSAPSPAIASRIRRSNGVGTRSTNPKDPLAATSNDTKRRSFSAPQRSNSRLLRRLSRPLSPTTVGQHRNTFSNPVNHSVSDPPGEEDGDSIGDAVDDFLSSPRLNQRIKHSQTGRIISFSEVGDPQGSAVFCCVGMGLTRFLTAFYDELALTLKLRLITPDRPGVGGSEPHADGLDTPLGWPDDVRAICEHLKICKFSIMAHSAGAIYALSTALRMSQHIRCRVHLLAPWIPPSQMSVISAQQEPIPTTALPYSQRILRALPTTFLRAANSSFLSTTSASITTSLPRSPRRGKRISSRSGTRTPAPESDGVNSQTRDDTSISPNEQRSGAYEDYSKENRPPRMVSPMNGNFSRATSVKERSSSYEIRLTGAIWEAATTGANPAVDLLVCLERRQPIGFRYVDITRAVVIHHGSKDTRVPVDNVKWLGKTMRRCEVRVLEGEGHGLMASAAVMGNVLMEMAQEWDDWNRVVKGRGGLDRRVTNAV